MVFFFKRFKKQIEEVEMEKQDRNWKLSFSDTIKILDLNPDGSCK